MGPWGKFPAFLSLSFCICNLRTNNLGFLRITRNEEHAFPPVLSGLTHAQDRCGQTAGGPGHTQHGLEHEAVTHGLW